MSELHGGAARGDRPPPAARSRWPPAPGAARPACSSSATCAPSREDGVAPSRILAITFTDRAAGELRERVRRSLIECGEREAARESAAAFVSTFHGFCARVLRTHAALAGLATDFAVLAEADGRDAARRGLRRRARALARDGRRARARRGVRGGAAARDDPQGATTSCAAAARGGRRCRPRCREPNRSRRARTSSAPPRSRCSAGCSRASPTPTPRSSARAGPSTSTTSSSRRRRCSRATTRCGAAWAERFELIMVDELQDTNARQIALLAALDRDNLFTVGDEHQSIYGFRHADVEIFRARSERLAPARRDRRAAHQLPLGAAAAGRDGRGLRTALRRALRAAASRAATPPAGEPVLELLLADRDGWEGHEERLGTSSSLRRRCGAARRRGCSPGASTS